MTDAESILRADEIVIFPDGPAITESVRKGEIVGLAGLDGHGQVPFLEILAGFRRASAGTVTVATKGQAVTITSPVEAARKGVGYMPADRKRNGIFPGIGVLDNFAFGNFARFSKRGWLSYRAARAALQEYRKDLSMAFASPSMHINRLSGGNQQKVLLARAMAGMPDVMLLNDPTRGVDIQTRRTLYDFFRRSVDERDLTYVILSTELEEIIELCDRVLVFRDNAISARLPREDMTLDVLMSAMFGQLERAAS